MRFDVLPLLAAASVPVFGERRCLSQNVRPHTRHEVVKSADHGRHNAHCHHLRYRYLRFSCSPSASSCGPTRAAATLLLRSRKYPPFRRVRSPVSIPFWLIRSFSLVFLSLLGKRTSLSELKSHFSRTFFCHLYNRSKF